MAGQPVPFEQGMIVWARVQPPRGPAKRRPVLIVTPTDEILLDQPMVAVAITTTFPEPPPASHVPLPWYPTGHPMTGLRRRSAAVCDWLVTFRPSDVEAIGGRVPTKPLAEVLARLRDLAGP